MAAWAAASEALSSSTRWPDWTPNAILARRLPTKAKPEYIVIETMWSKFACSHKHISACCDRGLSTVFVTAMIFE
jgi:hypothetical protein